MYKVGVAPGRFLPPHRGHLNAIIQAGTKVKKLYVVVCHDEERIRKECAENNMPYMSMNQRAMWLSKELQNLDHIEVLTLDESDIPSYPFGWEPWSDLLKETVPEHIDAIFGGEPSYKEGYTKYYPEAEYIIYDPERTRFPVSGTKIRENLYKHWDYVLGAARPFFTKKVLITGTESTGKTSLTKSLAKIYHTSWAEECGRYYSERYLGGNDDYLENEHFGRIAYQQRELEEDAIRHANKVTFLDTGAVVTQYYAEVYTGEQNEMVELLTDPDRYDLVLLFTPEVEWVDDGTRFLDKGRWELHEKLKGMYEDRGYDYVEIGGNYTERLNAAIELVDNLIK